MRRLGAAMVAVLLLAALLIVLAGSLAGPTQAANISVNTTDDELNSDGDCSLREAITATNTDTAVDACSAGSGADTITVPAGTYTLSIAGTGEDAAATGDLDVTDDLTINGAGAGSTTIEGCDSSGGPCTGIDRVFHVHDGATVAISGVTIQNGDAADNGGGIANLGTTTLTNVTVSGNSAVAGIGGGGGGIYNDYSGTATLTDVTVSGNTATYGGGGIVNIGTATLTDVTVSGNTTEYDGGGIVNDGVATLTNVTVSGNTATGMGGGIYNSGMATLTNVTVSGNTASVGGGISSIFMAPLRNTIVANSASGGDCFGIITSDGHNLDSDGTCGLSGTGDISNTDPWLGPLADNGGPTKTHALLSGSRAIDAGNNNGCPATDQRGLGRPVDGDGDGTATCDIGSFENQTVHYQWYDIFNASGGADPTAEVDVETQFGTRLDVPVGVARSLLAPARKDAEPSPDLYGVHLECYDYDGPEWDPDYEVDLTNQFHTLTDVAVGPATELCAPTYKVVGTGDPGPPPPEPHYVCYDIFEMAPPPGVTVETQFQSGSQILDNWAVKLCAPALKNGMGRLNLPHLTCYDIVGGYDPPEVVSLHTQFGLESDVPVNPAELFCVPTGKTVVSSPTPTPTPTPGPGDCPDPGSVPWSVPVGDADCDGFSTADEGVIGTDPADNCPDNPDDDAWPADMASSLPPPDDGYGKHDTVINIADLNQMLPAPLGTWGATPGNGPYGVRWDIVPDGVINISDLNKTLPPPLGAWGAICTQ